MPPYASHALRREHGRASRTASLNHRSIALHPGSWGRMGQVGERFHQIERFWLEPNHTHIHYWHWECNGLWNRSMLNSRSHQTPGWICGSMATPKAIIKLKYFIGLGLWYLHPTTWHIISSCRHECWDLLLHTNPGWTKLVEFDFMSRYGNLLRIQGW